MVGKLRELVPRTCNDYVVYRPGQAANVAVLIPQPPNAGPLFWTRRGPKNSRAKLPPRPGRLTLYRPLLALVPMAGIFAPPPPQSLQQILEDQQVAVLTAPEVAHFLADMAL